MSEPGQTVDITWALRRHYLLDPLLHEHVGTRIFNADEVPTRDPAGTPPDKRLSILPRITYRRVSTQRQLVMGGWVDLGWPQLQWDIHAATRRQATTIADLFRKRTMQARGTVGDEVACARRVSVLEMNDFEVYERETGIMRHTFVLRVAHEEEGPE